MPVTFDGSICGRSMTPFLRPGTRVRIVFAALSDLRPGDIAVVRRGEGYVAHRVMRSAQGVLYTKADGGRYAGEALPDDIVVGKLSAVMRGGRWVYCESAAWRFAGLLLSHILPYMIRAFRPVKTLFHSRSCEAPSA